RAVPGVDLALDVAGHVANAVEGGNGRAAELHHQTGHGDPRVCPENRPRVLYLRLAMGLARPPSDPPHCFARGLLKRDGELWKHLCSPQQRQSGPNLELEQIWNFGRVDPKKPDCRWP